MDPKTEQAIRYAHEKAATAVENLATGTDRILERLRTAYPEVSVGYDPSLPEGIARDIQEIRDAMTCEPAVGNEGSVNATLSKMTETQAAEIATRIVELEYQLRDALS